MSMAREYQSAMDAIKLYQKRIEELEIANSKIKTVYWAGSEEELLKAYDVLLEACKVAQVHIAMGRSEGSGSEAYQILGEAINATQTR